MTKTAQLCNLKNVAERKACVIPSLAQVGTYHDRMTISTLAPVSDAQTRTETDAVFQ
jgi:hypothetical protein